MTWVGAGKATATQTGNQLTVNQTTPAALLNWSSFNISADGKVEFKQPDVSSTAINRIFQADPSKLFGSLSANGHIYLLNQNGILFGAGSQVNVGGLVAASLDISPAALQNGIAGAKTDPAFQPFADANGKPVPGGPVTVQSGATITANGGQVLVFAPTVENDGLIQTPDGQTMLAAGQRVFLAAADPTSNQNLRGLLVLVGDGGNVTNGGTANGLPAGSLGQIIANRGNVTLAGLAVNQNGRISATTTVRANGSILLQAVDTTNPTLTSNLTSGASRQGSLTLGAGSTSSVSLEGGSADTTVDSNKQLPSLVQLTGSNVAVLDRATISAAGGEVDLNASVQPNLTPTQLPAQDSSRISIASTAVIDVSGATDTLPVEDNSLTVQLRATELANFPANRASALHGETVYVDLRRHGTYADGSTWIGTPVADISGDVGAIQHDVFWRNLTGGTINLNSAGTVLVGKGATLNVSGGQIDWHSGFVQSSVLMGADGKAYNIASANPNLTYLGTLDSFTLANPRWGTSVTLALPGHDPRGQYQAGYAQGADAGTVDIVAPTVALDGNIVASTVTGPLQRLPGTAPPPRLPGAPLDPSQLRAADQAPLGGQLILGVQQAITDPTTAREGVQAVVFQPGWVLPGLSGSAAGGAFNLVYDPLPQTITVLRPDLLGPAAVTRLQVAAEGQITLPTGTTLNAGPGGSVDLEAGRVLDNGSIVAPAGAITLVAAATTQFNASTNQPTPGLFLNSGAQLAVNGTWVNDQLVAGSQRSPLWTSGGSIKLSANGASLAVPQGVLLDASAGAELSNTGQVIGGSGGSISVAAAPVVGNPSFVTVFDPTLRGFALRSGGKLSVTLPTLCVSSTACSTPGAMRLTPSLLTDDGFGSITLKSNVDGFTVESDVNSAIRQANFTLLPGMTTSPSGSPFESLTALTTLPAYARQPENLTLSTTTAFGGATSDGGVMLAQGSQLNFDPLAQFNVGSDFRVFANGIVRDPGGNVTLAITSDVIDPTFRPYQGIWLGGSSLIDTSGVAQLTPNNMGFLTGSVLAGGSIFLNAQHGTLVTLPGSSLEASGAVAAVDIPASATAPGAYTRASIASSGGAISLFGAEGLFANGTLDAHSGGAGAAGGTLTVTLDGSLGSGRAADIGNNPYPIAPRILDITAANSPLVTDEGLAIPVLLNGVGKISAATINAGGFDDVELLARDLRIVSGGNFSVPNTGIGAVQLDPGVVLSPAARLVIDAPEIRAAGSGEVSLSAGYVALGSTDTLAQQISKAPTTGGATLDVDGGFVDLVGRFDLQGFGSATIASASDIRTVGVLGPGAQTPQGLLATAGDLRLAAQQIYPSTLTSYAVRLTGQDPSATLSIQGKPGTADDVLSAGGSLLLQAPSIVNSGTVRAPFGSISLVGGNLTSTDLNGPLAVNSNGNVTLSPGSGLSVSADGLTVPFGATQAGQDWVYTIRPGIPSVSLVYGGSDGQVAPPQKTVSISAGELGFQSGAKIDLSGGGDLLAYEWIPGTGGTTDYLDSQTSPNTFAVLPGYRLGVAPIDPLADTGFTLRPGASVYLAGGNGLPAGTYTLLPPRYALLPGAFLVTAVSGFMDLSPSQPLPQLDGSTIVAGRLVDGATGLGATRTSGFDVAPGSLALTRSQYTTTSASSFFAKQAQTAADAASSAGNPVAAVAPQLPEDAGALAIQVSRSLTLSGTLTAPAATGGRGSSLDLSASNLVIGAPSANTPPNAVSIDPQQLDSLGAESILLGGVRTFGAGSTSVAVNSSNVEIGEGVSLTAPEVTLVANTSLTLDSGSVVKASGATLTANESLKVPTGVAIVRVSTGPQADLSATPGSTLGTLTVADGATLSAPGSLLAQAAGAVDFGGNILAQGAAVRLGSSSIALGDVPDGYNGFAIRAPLIAGLTGANLELDAPNAIQVFGAVDLNLDQLTLNSYGVSAAAQQGSAAAPASLEVTANQVTAANRATDGSSSTPAAGGVFQVNAGSVNLGPGDFALSGFATTRINAARDVSVAGDGTLSATGDLSLDAGVFQTRGAFNYAMGAGPDGHLVTASTVSVAATDQGAPGGQLGFKGSDVTLGGHFVLPSGGLIAESTGSGALTQVTVGAVLDLAGRAVVFDGKTVSSPGGSISLTSDGGSIAVASGAVLDVSAGKGSAAGGSVALSAPGGNIALDGILQGAGGAGSAGASLSVAAQSLDFAALLAKAGTGGFTGDWDVHLRGAGDLTVGAGDQIRTSAVTLTADRGSVRVFGGIDVSSALGGDISLIAQQDVEVAGSLTTTSLAHAERGGSISLESTAGGVYLDSGSALILGGTAPAGAPAPTAGNVWIRAPGSSVLTPGRLRLDGRIDGANQITVEGFHPAYQVAAGSSLDLTGAMADAGDFMTGVTNSNLLQTLGHGDSRLQIIPGIEIQSPGDLNVNSTLDLSGFRFGANGVPGALTVRAAGNLNIDASITDGFPSIDPSNPISGYMLPTTPGPSWSYRLAAGADLASANPLAVLPGTQVAAGGGSVILAKGTPSDVNTGVAAPIVVRTGTGNIEIAAAQDLVLRSQASVIYTAGEAGPGLILTDTLNGLAYPVNGGSIDIRAGGNIVGATSDQLFSNWLWRTGSQPDSPFGFVPTAWTIAFDRFEQGVGALGGGDVTIRAGGNISNLGAVAPSIGVPSADGLSTTEVNSGVLTVQAGGDIVGGKFLDMAGSAGITAGGGLSAGTPQQSSNGTQLSALNPVLALGDSQFAVSARRNATIETVLDPTLLPQASAQAAFTPFSTYFSTYSDRSSVSIESTGGGVTLVNETGQISGDTASSALAATSLFIPFSSTHGSAIALRAYAPTLEVDALGGNINVAGSMDLWPAAHGNLDLLTSGSIALGSAGKAGIHVVLSDADPTALPSVTAPLDDPFTQFSNLDGVSAATNIESGGFYAPQPVHGGSYADDGQPDLVPVRIVALGGDLTQQPTDANTSSLLFFAKPTDVIAGRDIEDLGIFVQQFSPANVSTISAGRDFIYPAPRNATGQLALNTRTVDVSGPGLLQVSAGRNVGLGTSAGITSDGNLFNPALPQGGADISVTAGVNGPPDDAAFIAKYLGMGSAYQSDLVHYMELMSGTPQLDPATALAQFQQVRSVQQQGLIQQIFFDELRAGGRAAAAAGPGHNDFTRAFTALETLFPGSNPHLSAGETDPYQGGIALYFSRIYTRSGGNINLFAPGGDINVGQATPASALGVGKTPDQLGIVAQGVGSVSAFAYGDEAVNQSRVFAGDGGNILLWSTEGNIDAGRGSKSAISAPPPSVTYDKNGVPTFLTPPVLTGSGIQTLATSTGTKAGDVDLFAPHGVVNASDAGIVAGNLTIAATAVLGTNNITVTGTSVGVPVQVTGQGIAAAAAGSSGASATNAAQTSVSDSGRDKSSQAPIADAALGWLDVFVVGFGEEQCAAENLDCLKRQPAK